MDVGDDLQTYIRISIQIVAVAPIHSARAVCFKVSKLNCREPYRGYINIPG